MRPPRFDVLQIDAVIPDLGIGHGNNLTFVRGIRQDLLVAGHGSIETNLAAGLGASAKTTAAVNCSIFQSQDCIHRVHHRVKFRRMLGRNSRRSSSRIPCEDYARAFSMTLPATSVSRSSRPLWR